jgi:hypothetical protein
MLRPSVLTHRSRSRRLFAVVPLVVAVAFVASGCDRLTGGGWIDSAMPLSGGKASFSFTAHCSNTTIDGIPAAEFYDGQFEFTDTAFDPGLRIHGDIQPFGGVEPGTTCSQFKKADLDLLGASGFQGVYRTQSKSGPVRQGNFVVTVADGGEPSTITGDDICISLDGAFIYPTHCGIVQGGNIQVD